VTPARRRLDDAPRVEPPDRAAWRSWLTDHSGGPGGVWLVLPRRPAGRDVAFTYEDAVREALCFGWVDSTARALDDTRTMLWLAPRKPGSGWAGTNKRRIAELEAAGLMAEPGRRVVEAARADGSWSLLDDVEAGVVPDDLAAALAGVPGARETWDAFPPSARRAALAWVALARRPETRRRRIVETAQKAGRGERVAP
jgi:uncharacterized protein YdeI (YjbR/CyaY-like superfamily)